jgi:hypothetical protein
LDFLNERGHGGSNGVAPDDFGRFWTIQRSFAEYFVAGDAEMAK